MDASLSKSTLRSRLRGFNWKLLGLISAALVAMVFVHTTPLRALITDWQGMKHYLDQTEPYAHLVFVGATLLLVALGMPRLPLCALAGLGFGFFEGLLLVQVGCLAGAYLPFRGARYFADRDRLPARLERGLARIVPRHASIWSIFLIRQAPVNGLLVNCVLGGRRVPSHVFLIGSGLGFLPQAIAATLIGSGLGKTTLLWSIGQLSMAAFLVILAAVCTRYGWKMWRARRRQTFQADGGGIAAFAMPMLRHLGTALATRFNRWRPHLDRPTWRVLAVLAMLATATFAIRLSAPSDLEGYAQHRNIGYVMDVLARSQWWLPHDLDGHITSKPPLHTWLAAGASWAFGDVNRFTLALPSFLAILGTSWLLFLAGRRYLGFWPACYGAAMFVASPLVIKHVALVRPDAVFTFTVALASWLAFRAWRHGKSWTPFWLAVTAAILTKGPLGLVLAGGGLVAALWERRSGHVAPIRRGHAVGVMCLLGCLGLWGWFTLQAQGMAVVDKMIFDELLGHAAGAGRSDIPGAAFWKPLAYLLGRFMPWSLLTAWAVYDLWQHPAADDLRRQWERFLVCWLGVGLAVFALAANHRADHLLPLMPAAALLAGRQLEPIALAWGRPMARRAVALTVMLLLTGLAVYYHQMPPRRAKVAAHTESMKSLALALREQFGEDVSLLSVDTPTTLGLYLGDFERKVPMQEAAKRLEDDQSQLIAVHDLDELRAHLKDGSPALHMVLRWPDEDDGDAEVYIVNSASGGADFLQDG